MTKNAVTTRGGLFVRVAVGSQNPAKIGAVHTAFAKMEMDVEIIGIGTNSEVSEQPFSDEETINGAINRARNVLKNVQAGGQPCDYGIGLEGGVVETPFGLFVCNWGAVTDRHGNVGIGGGHRVQLPDTIAQALRQGEELGTVIDRWAGGHDIRKKEGTIGILTDDHITRETMFRDVVICAFSRFLNPDYYTNP